MALLERDTELAQLRATLEAAADGTGSVVVVSGVAGMGKSTSGSGLSSRHEAADQVAALDAGWR